MSYNHDDLFTTNILSLLSLSYHFLTLLNSRLNIRQLTLACRYKIAEKLSAGRKQHTWLRNLREWFGLSTISIFKVAASGVKIALRLSNLR